MYTCARHMRNTKHLTTSQSGTMNQDMNGIQPYLMSLPSLLQNLKVVCLFPFGIPTAVPNGR